MREKSPSPIWKCLWPAAVFLLAAAAVMQVQSGNAGDKNWLLLAARMWLGGKKLYVDIFEVNPPLIIWLYAIPEFFSMHLLPLADFQILALLGLIISGWSVWLGVRLIRLHPAFADDAPAQARFALLLAGIFVFFTTQVYFFDRDDIFLVMTFPYTLRFMPALARQRLSLKLRLATALFAAVGYCIKPHTLIVFAALQLLYIWRERSAAILISLENSIIYAGAMLYLFCVWFFAREYIEVIMPMAALTYSGYSRRSNGYLFASLAFVSAGLTFADFRPRHATPYRRDAYYFIGVCAALLAYALASNGWGYSYNPLLCMLLFVSGWMLWDYGWLKRDAQSRGLAARQFAFGLRGCIANLGINAAYMILCIWVFFTSASCDKYVECRQQDLYLRYLKEHHVRSFGTLSMNFKKWTALVRESGVSWETRFNHLWMLPRLLQGGDAFAARYPWIVNYVGNGLAEDLNARKPDILFVDTNDGILGYPHPVDIPAYFSRVPQFAQAWRHYHYTSTIDQCEKLLKKPEPGGPQATAVNVQVQTDCRFAIYSRVD